MPVNLRAKKRLVSRIVGVGVNRVRFDTDHLDDVADAITRDDIRSLITANTISIKSFKGTSRGCLLYTSPSPRTREDLV